MCASRGTLWLLPFNLPDPHSAATPHPTCTLRKEQKHVKNSSTEKVEVLGIGGSLRKGSYNLALLRTAQELAPEEMTIQIFDNETLILIPTYNEDVRERGDLKLWKF